MILPVTHLNFGSASCGISVKNPVVSPNGPTLIIINKLLALLIYYPFRHNCWKKNFDSPRTLYSRSTSIQQNKAVLHVSLLEAQSDQSLYVAVLLAKPSAVEFSTSPKSFRSDTDCSISYPIFTIAILIQCHLFLFLYIGSEPSSNILLIYMYEIRSAFLKHRSFLHGDLFYRHFSALYLFGLLNAQIENDLMHVIRICLSIKYWHFCIYSPVSNILPISSISSKSFKTFNPPCLGYHEFPSAI